MKNMMDVMKQVQQLQTRMQSMQEELERLEVTGESGGGLIGVTLGGKGDLRTLRIDPSLVKPDEVEILEDLIVAAFQNAKLKLDAEQQERMKTAAGGLPLPPGLKLF